MALEPRGKTALVTGGGSGICLAFTKKLLDEGCNVLVADLALGPDAQEVIDKGGSSAKAVFVKTDVTNWTQLQNAFDAAMKAFGRLDVVVPGAGIFEPPSANFWHFNQGVDTIETSHYKTLEINITHPIRATQLAIDYFQRQKLGHGVVLLISSIAAQLALIPVPLYATSKHAISGFTRSMDYLEVLANIRVVAVAPGCVKTPIWTSDKLPWLDEAVDTWVSTESVVETMIDLITNPKHVGGTILEVGVDVVRPVHLLNDPGPSGRGHTVAGIGAAVADVGKYVQVNFGQ